MPAVANRQSVRASGALCIANPASRHSRRSITTRRTCAGCSRALASGAVMAHPDASGRKRSATGGYFHDWFCRTLALHALPLRTLETKRPRDLRPEGVRVASGDRGGRSPRESDRDYAWRYRLRSPIRRSSCFVQSHASALRRVGHSANRIALTKFGFMENLVSKKRRRGEGRGQNAPFFRCATFF